MPKTIYTIDEAFVCRVTTFDSNYNIVQHDVYFEVGLINF